jgi:hypothetical protein
MIVAKDEVNTILGSPYVEQDLKAQRLAEGLICITCLWSRTGENPMYGILEGAQETWTMEKAKRARKAETPKRPSLHLRSSAPELYSTRNLQCRINGVSHNRLAAFLTLRQAKIVKSEAILEATLLDLQIFLCFLP